MSQDAFSKLVGIPLETIRSYEMGRLKVSAESAIKISAATGVDPALLMLEEGEPRFYTKKLFDNYRSSPPFPENALSFEKLAQDAVTATLRAALAAKSSQPTPDKYYSFCFALNRFLAEQVSLLGLDQKYSTELQEHTAVTKKPCGTEKLKIWRGRIADSHPDYARWQAKFDPAWNDDDLVEVEETQWRVSAPLCSFQHGIMRTRYEVIHHLIKGQIRGTTIEYFYNAISADGITRQPVKEIVSAGQANELLFVSDPPPPYDADALVKTPLAHHAGEVWEVKIRAGPLGAKTPASARAKGKKRS